MKITQSNFIIKLKERKEKALEYVIDKYGWIIKSIVKKHLYNLEHYQDECINDILLAIWNNIERFDENKGTFQNWVAGISRFKAIDYKRKYLKTLTFENIDTLELASKDNVFNAVTKKEINADLDELLNYLKPEDKAIFLKLYIEEEDINQVSNETGLKKEVIYNRLSRGKKKLKKRLFFL